MKIWNIYQLNKQDKELLSRLKISSETTSEIPVEIDFLKFSGSREVYIRHVFYNEIDIKPFLSLQTIQYYTSRIEEDLQNERT